MELMLPSTEEGSLIFKQWLAEKHDHPVEFFPANAYGYGLVEKESSDEWLIKMACVLQPFHFPGNVLASYFSEDPTVFFQKQALRALKKVPFGPPFNAHKITVLIRTVHTRSISVALRYGFRGEAILKDHYGPGEDATILGLLRSDVIKEQEDVL